MKKHEKTIEDSANEILSNLSEDTKIKFADAERHSMGVLMIIALAVVTVVAIICVNSSNNITSILGCVFMTILCAILIVICVKIGKASKDKLALRYIKKKLRNGEIVDAEIFSEENCSKFHITKEILILANGWSTTKLLIDSENKKFIYQRGKSDSKTYSFSDIISYEVYENGVSKVQGRVGSALIGGAFFGLGGAIIGASRSRNIDETCTQLQLIIRLNDLECPQIVITYVNKVSWEKSSLTYRNLKNNLQSVCSVLEFMLNNKMLEQSEIKQSENKVEPTKKEQLQELKEMLDDGLITQDDFELKKKQILGL